MLRLATFVIRGSRAGIPSPWRIQCPPWSASMSTAAPRANRQTTGTDPEAWTLPQVKRTQGRCPQSSRRFCSRSHKAQAWDADNILTPAIASPRSEHSDDDFRMPGGNRQGKSEPRPRAAFSDQPAGTRRAEQHRQPGSKSTPAAKSPEITCVAGSRPLRRCRKGRAGREK